MLGLLNTLNLGARALQAQETGLEVTGQNLSNVNNPACSRQRVQISTSSTTSPTSTSSLSDQLNSLFNAFQSVVTDPTSTAQRQALVNQAQSLTESLNQASQSLTSLNGSLNTTLNNNVTSANQLLSDIAGLNDQIAKATANSGNANDLNDTREQDLEQLANLTNIQTTANADGTVAVSVVVGAQLVSGNQVTNYNTVNTMLLNQRDSVSGVSIEEEMSNMITYQYAYEASSKIITTVDQMLQTAISLKT